MSFPLSKYQFYVHNNRVIAVSTYAGKTVRGIAICDSNDKFDIELGKKIAAARCNEKIAKKRLDRSVKKLAEAKHDVAQAEKHKNDMEAYHNDAYVAYNLAAMEHDLLIASLRTKTVD